MTKAVELAQVASTGVSEAFKNRIINGAMVISQYNGTSSVTPTTDTYVIDRFKAVRSQNNLAYQQNAGSVTPPVGFSNYLGITATTGATITGPDYWYLYHFIEGFDTADLQWGTANAKTVTLSFWVRASLTGSYSVGFHNGAEDRAYLVPYTITSANTWQQVSITVPGDTTGTWVGATNGKGIGVWFNLGVGSVFGTTTANSWIAGWNPGLTTGVQFAANAGATFYLTGVQLEVGSTATSFEYRPYTTELQLCQRYFAKIGGTTSTEGIGAGNLQDVASSGWFYVKYPVTMRAAPTAAFSSLRATNNADYVLTVSSIRGQYNGIDSSNIGFNFSSSGTTYAAVQLQTSATAGFLSFASEL